MKRFLFFLMLSVGLLSIEVDRKKLDGKLNRAPPQWMVEQIEKDLEPFKTNGITVKNLNQTYDQIKNVWPCASRIYILNNQVFIQNIADYPLSRSNSKAIFCLHEFTKYVTFPDIDVILTAFEQFGLPNVNLSAPVFAVCKLKGNKQAVLYPELTMIGRRQAQIESILKYRISDQWNKKSDLAFWRGSTTGGGYDTHTNLRQKIVALSMKKPDYIEAAFSPYKQNKYKYIKNYRLEGNIEVSDQLKYKYLIAADGNTFASSLGWQLLSNSVVFKNNSKWIEWYYDAIKPYEHYIPYKRDASDLIQKIQWAKEHDAEAKRIAENATDFFLYNLMIEDVIVYIYHLFHEYAKLQKFKVEK